MSKPKNRTVYPKEDNSKDTIQKLRAQVRRLQKEVKNLKSELKTAEAAFEKTIEFLGEKTEDFSLEKMLEAAKEGKVQRKPKTSYNECPECGKKGRYSKPVPFGKIELCRYCDYRKLIKE
tara:strand:+ start:2577 stop:2936 length:360 start_codon:yes stop_codon:yes gene_type:complete